MNGILIKEKRLKRINTLVLVILILPLLLAGCGKGSVISIGGSKKNCPIGDSLLEEGTITIADKGDNLYPAYLENLKELLRLNANLRAIRALKEKCNE